VQSAADDRSTHEEHDRDGGDIAGSREPSEFETPEIQNERDESDIRGAFAIAF
jgi:hypothetical protein